MKKLLNISLLSAVLLASSSCSKDYLDTKPTASASEEASFSSTENVKLVVNGLAKMMTQQYLSTQGLNGEGTIKMWYGNYPGANFSLNLSGWAAIINSTYNENVTSVYLYYPWYYYYKLIAGANAVIHKVDAASGLEKDKQFLKAQAYTYRAYAYMMLAQLYCYRWQDSGNGTSDGLVLRKDLSTGDFPLSTLADTYASIYDDLDKALELFAASGVARSKNYETNSNVAHAVYARAALNRQDYPNAETHAVAARTGYPLMSVADYKAGFANPTSEWIWSTYGASDETLYFYSYHAYIAYNSTASNVRSIPKSIGRELYNKIPATDIRRGLFLDPAGMAYNGTTGVAGAPLRAKAFDLFPALDPAAATYAWMQFKIKANDMPGVANLNHFRSSEMYLIEAEAKYFQQKPDAEIQAVLVALTATSGRDPNYTCTKTGVDLLNEIKTYRGIELWGEGFDWFDLKRWNDPLIRKTFANGGNFITALAVTIQPTANNKWTWKIPLRESDYNDALE
jgi:hypothetical protein